MARFKFWTLERVEILRTRWNAGDSTAEIAKVLGCKEKSVREARYYHKLPPRKIGRGLIVWTQAMDSELRLAREKGMGFPSIAKQMGISDSVIRKRARVLQLPFRMIKRSRRSAAMLLQPNARGYFDSAAVVSRLLERWAA